MATPSAADADRRDAFAPPDVPTQPEPAAVQPKRAGVASGGIAPPQRAAPLREDRTAESARQAPDAAIGTRAGATRATAPAALAPRTATGRAPVAAGASAERFADPAVEAKAKERAPLSVTDWIALIRKLVADRRNDDAVLELKAFRLAHPDADTLLPPELRDWPPGAR